MTRANHLGQGWSLPLRPSASRGGFDYRAGADQVRQAIWIILATEPGERVMRPSFGCGLRRYLMSPNSPGTRALIRRDVENSLSQWEPRIRLAEVTVSPGDDPSLVVIDVRYVLARDGSEGNLVYPFYLT